jgi:hypothetical protein
MQILHGKLSRRGHRDLDANLEQSMHKSKLSGFIIDCRTDDLEAAASFWSRALGMPVHELAGSENVGYKGLSDAQHGLDIEVQRVDHPSRVHLDIETTISRPKFAGSRRSAPKSFNKFMAGG